MSLPGWLGMRIGAIMLALPHILGGVGKIAANPSDGAGWSEFGSAVGGVLLAFGVRRKLIAAKPQ